MFSFCSSGAAFGEHTIVSRKVVHWFRATSFGTPVGPWRETMREARIDLIRQGLGSYDDDGWFFITVPGGIDRRSAWMDFELVALLHQARCATQQTRPMTVKVSPSPKMIS